MAETVIKKDFGLFDPALVGPAIKMSFVKLKPSILAKNPVMFVTGVVALLSTIYTVFPGHNNTVSIAVLAQISVWLWFTVLFANFAEALAEGRGKARADSLRGIKTETTAKKLAHFNDKTWKSVPSASLKMEDIILCETGDMIPADGEVIEGIASVNESAITGESAPVIRESGGDRSAVTGGTKVASDWIKIRVTQKPGESFIDRIIALVEGAKRQKTPNEIALTILLVGMTIIFLFVVATLAPFALYGGAVIPMPYLLALLVTLIPTTIGGLLSAIGIAGMDRLVKANVIAKSGRAVEAAGDVNTLLLDKTGTITFGNRMASEFVPVLGVELDELASAAYLASLSDETPEGKSTVELAKTKYKVSSKNDKNIVEFIPFSAQTRMSGVNLKDGSDIRKGAEDSIYAYVGTVDKRIMNFCVEAVAKIARSGGTPLVVAKNKKLLGVIHLKDIIKPNIKERFAMLRKMGIKTVMITGDNALTAAAIAAEAGVDDFLAQATPEMKLALIRKEQAEGKLVAMCGDGSNDAPALAQADIGVAMNDGTPAAREAGNMVDLDSDPTKLIEVVMIGKQLLISRGSLTTFSIANDVAKYFAIIPALFITAYPQLKALNVMELHSPQSAILSAVIFNALIIIALIPLAIRGVKYRPESASALLRRNLLIYGLGGVIVPFIGIKLVDMIITTLGIV
jgi:K+-transporting ATPase ATPase B chain